MSAGSSLVDNPKSASLLHHAYDKAAWAMWYKNEAETYGCDWRGVSVKTQAIEKGILPHTPNPGLLDESKKQTCSA